MLVGDARERLLELPAGSVQCVVTSPPYWGLRDYGTEPLVWGGDPSCAHEWDSVKGRGISGGLSAKLTSNAGSRVGSEQSQQCRCGAWCGSFGREHTPDLYAQHLVEIFRQIWRVLREDGVCYLNLGDSYDDGPLGIPWMVAFALRADGWRLAARIVWAKGISFCEAYAGSVMPESVTKRPTRAHEDIFMLAKSADYYWDHEAIKEQVWPDGTMAGFGSGRREGNRLWPGGVVYDGVRHVRDVWAISPQPFNGEFCTACRRYYDGPGKARIQVVPGDVRGKHGRDSESGHRSGGFSSPSIEDQIDNPIREERICVCGRSDAWLSHFATFPYDLVAPMIRAGTSERGCCARCGAPFRRLVEHENAAIRMSPRTFLKRSLDLRTACGGTQDQPARSRTVGWQPACGCVSDGPRPCVVLDPFAGSGTVAVVAQRLGRDSIGIELNQNYADMACHRIVADAPLFNGVAGFQIETVGRGASNG